MTTPRYNINLTIDTDDLTKKEIKNQLIHKLTKHVPEQEHDLVTINKIEKVHNEK